MRTKPQNRQKTGRANRTSFKPGQSGNPGGRPKLPADAREAYRAMHPRALERLQELVESKEEAVALRACLAVIERVEGKAPQSHQVTVGRSLEDLIRETVDKPALNR